MFKKLTTTLMIKRWNFSIASSRSFWIVFKTRGVVRPQPVDYLMSTGVGDRNTKWLAEENENKRYAVAFLESGGRGYRGNASFHFPLPALVLSLLGLKKLPPKTFCLGFLTGSVNTFGSSWMSDENAWNALGSLLATKK
jgi:hypothetical protein